MDKEKTGFTPPEVEKIAQTQQQDDREASGNIGSISEQLRDRAISEGKEREHSHDYIPNPKDNPKAQLREKCSDESVDVGKGVFAIESINRGETIATFEGAIYSADRISELPNQYLIDHVIQISERDYLMNETGFAHLANHSCDPNCGIIEGVKVVAMRDIEPGEEITWDYEMSEDSDWEMQECQCNSDNCRTQIRAFRFMPPEVRKKYEGFISPWLVDKYSQTTSVENLCAPEITDKHIQDLADIIRRVFCNDWDEYAFCPCCDPVQPLGKKMSARKAYEIKNSCTVGDDQDIGLETLGDESLLPVCDTPGCGTRMEQFLHPQGTLDCLTSKLKEDAWLSLLRDWQGNLVGFNYVYMRTLREIFEKEWGHLYSYADKDRRPDHTRDFENFHSRVSRAFIENFGYEAEEDGLISPETPMLAANCIAVDRRFRKSGNMTKLMLNTLKSLPDDAFKCVVASEVIVGEVSSQISIGSGGVLVPGVINPDRIKNGDSCLTFSPLSNYKKLLMPKG